MTEATSNGGFRQLRGAAMLNIRINLMIDLKKVFASSLVAFMLLSNLITPAYALKSVPSVSTEKTVTVSLKHLKVKTTRTAAVEAVTSPQVKYFDAEALAFLTVYAKGWSIKEWTCLRFIWTKESNFNPKALNKSSGAYGIAQFMPSTWGNYKVTQTEQARLQIKYGLRYIEKRYGSTNDPTGACNAEAFWRSKGWY
jgi:hypothetical protein